MINIIGIILLYKFIIDIIKLYYKIIPLLIPFVLLQVSVNNGLNVSVTNIKS